ncbi:MAG: translation elongation factor Ts [Phototrophicaceae bacterium]
MAVKVSAADVKALRDMTGAGPLDCKNALVENDGDLEKAAEALRQKGIAKAVKKLGKGRTMNEGKVEIYQHHDGRLGAMVEINCETDFVAKNEAFQRFAKDVALHISSMKPEYISRADIPQADIDAQKVALSAMDDLDGKPDNIKEKIVEGRLEKWYQEKVLMEQEFLKDDSKTVGQLLEETVAELGESMQIGRFSRFALGEYGDDAEEDGDEE